MLGQKLLRLPPCPSPLWSLSPVAMLLLSLLAGCCLSPVLALPVVEDGAPTSAPAVVVKNGTYSGVHAPGYGQDFFLGMPYAQKAERWMQAQSLNDTWQDSREATAYPKHCVGYGGDMTGYEVSEDCLYLNVVRPAGLSDTADLPVAVWIHGGGLFMGGSADKRYNLSFIVEESVKQGTPMIGVSLNYRLSAFGFPQGKQAMDAGIANIGFLDQRLALRWINENIAAFGGSPNKVTIWGESSGAESVSAQVFAYNGRDDGLFRGAIAQSGFGGVIPTRFPGGFNNTAAPQAVFDALVTNTTCAPTVGTDKVITCLRGLPFEEINAVLNGTAPPGPWAPQFDGDFFADYPANQIDQAKFPKIPVLIGHNTDEGTSFGKPGINTDADLAAAIRQSMLSEGAVTATGKSAQALVDELMYLYPDIQSRGIPSLASWPDVITPGSAEVARLGLQYRRSNALFGDLSMAYCRRRASRAWAAAGLSSWSYRFDAGVVGVPPSVSSAHFFEVAYVFANLAGVGYAPNARPFPADAPGVAAYTDLAKAMSTAWVNFVTGLDPNGAAAPSTAALPAWPAYNLTAGGGVGQNIVFAAKGDGSYVEVDDYRAEGINWLIENSLTVLGN